MNKNSEPAVPANTDKDDWVRLPRPPGTLRGLSRSFLFQLCAAGKIRSMVLNSPPAKGCRVKRKTKRGVRLLQLSSLDAYLDAEFVRQHEADELTHYNEGEGKE